MKTLSKLALGAAILSASTFSQAKTTTWTTDFGCPINQMAGMEFGLDLSGEMSATAKTSSDGFSPEKSIESLTLNFAHANKISVGNFKNVGPDMYRAQVNGPWVFKNVIVEVKPDQLHNFGQLSGRIFVPDHTNINNNLEFAIGTDLLTFNCPIVDATARKVVDTTAKTIDGKRLTLKLKDRLGMHFGPTPPAPGYEQGIEVNALWMGRGERTFFLPISHPESEFDRFTAVGFKIDSHTLPDGQIDHMIAVRYEDEHGASFETPMQPLQMILDQVYGPAF